MDTEQKTTAEEWYAPEVEGAARVRVNVRSLAEYACEGGDLFAEAGAAEAMRQGMRAHQARQAGYGEAERAEAVLSGEYPLSAGVLSLFGRADGLRRGDAGWLVEEIKWVAQPLPEGFGGYAAHWLQACLYALLLCDREGLDQCGVRLHYEDARGGEADLEKTYRRGELYAMMAEAGEPFLAYQIGLERLRQGRLESARALDFPFPEYRAGQRKLAQNAYVALRDGKALICQAPTGLGKTMAALFAGAKALGEGRCQRVFFLTARGTGRLAAADALRRMEAAGLKARWAVLTAKDSMCAMEEKRCDPEYCPRARGYYDRRREAVRASLGSACLDRDAIWELAEEYQLCPFELSLDLAETADFIIGDYNYAFDPRVRLERFFQRKTGAALLVDEAHNLPDRAREMYSAWLDREEMRLRRRELGRLRGRKSAGYKALTAFLKSWQGWEAGPMRLEEEPRPEALQAAETLKAALERAGEVESPAYWSVVWFLRAAAAFDPQWDRFAWGEDGDGGARMGVWCMESGGRLHRTLKKCAGAVFFSATLTPLEFYRDRLGAEAGESALLKLPSPFPRENLTVTCAPLSTRYRDRERTLPRVAQLIEKFARETPGNILVCFPSYAYLEGVRGILREDESRKWLYQRRDMGDEERKAFLEAFEAGGPVAAFVTMGGLFTEGIDLAGEKLVGAVIVGAGLPQVGFETEELRKWYDEKGEDGFAFAYAYPGAARVIQAAGRVIRTPEDRGRILLIDDRWMEEGYRALLPEGW